MTLSHGFRRLATSIEELETNGLEILDVATSDDEPNRRLTVELTVSVPFADDGEAERTESAEEDRIDDPGREREGDDGHGDAGTEHPTVRERVIDPLPVKDDSVNGTTPPDGDDRPDDDGRRDDADQTAASAEAPGDQPNETARDEGSDGTSDDDRPSDDGVVACPMSDCDATFESEHGMKIHRTKVHRHVDGSDADELPAYRDPDRLREVHEACDSFTEMRDALGTDVSAQTVRRQMIAHGIYDPEEADAGSSGDAGSDGSQDDGAETVVDDEQADEQADTRADGPAESDIELPEGVTVADLKTAVLDAKTLYDVQKHFDLDRDEAMQLLETYDLLSVVHGRVSNRDARKQVDEDEITRRILERVPVAQASSA